MVVGMNRGVAKGEPSVDHLGRTTPLETKPPIKVIWPDQPNSKIS
jgi:hypothetical protein